MEATEKSPSAPSVVDETEAPADPARLSEVVKTHYEFIWRTLRRLGLPPSAADDATQQVFLIVSRRLGTIAVGAERTFLYRTAVRVTCDARRAHNRQLKRTSDEEVGTLADPTPNPEELTDQKRARVLLDQLIAGLDEELQEVFVLFELDRMPIPEISELLGIPPGTCSSRLRRAREDFKEALKRMQARQAHQEGKART